MTVTQRHDHGERGVRADSKLAEKIAVQLEDRIVELGWPIGAVIGSEPELLAELNVSRAAFREAVRLLEHHSVAKMRRGPGGGLVVTEPDTSSVTRAAILRLRYDHASVRDIFEARTALELKSVELAAERIDEEGIATLRGALERERRAQESGFVGSHDIHHAIAALTGNPAISLFLDVLTQLTLPRAEGPETREVRRHSVRHAHEKIVDAIVSGDPSLARYRMQAHINAIAEYAQQTL